MNPEQWFSSIRALADGDEPYLRALEAAAPFDAVAYAQQLDLHRLMPWVEPAVLSAAGRARLPAALVEAVATGSDTRRRRHDDVVQETLEVQDAKAFIIGSFPLSIELPTDLAARLTTVFLYDLGADYLKVAEELLRRLGFDDARRRVSEQLAVA